MKPFTICTLKRLSKALKGKPLCGLDNEGEMNEWVWWENENVAKIKIWKVNLVFCPL